MWVRGVVEVDAQITVGDAGRGKELGVEGRCGREVRWIRGTWRVGKVGVAWWEWLGRAQANGGGMRVEKRESVNENWGTTPRPLQGGGGGDGGWVGWVKKDAEKQESRHSREGSPWQRASRGADQKGGGAGGTHEGEQSAARCAAGTAATAVLRLAAAGGGGLVGQSLAG